MTNSSSISPKEFLTQAEQKYGKNIALLLKLIMFGAGAVGLFFLGPAILATLTTLVAIVGEMIFLAGLCGIAFVMYMLVTNPKIRAILGDQFDGLINTIRAESIKINAIDRLKAYADEYLQGKVNLVQGVKNFIKGKQKWHLDQVEKKTAELANLDEQAKLRKKRSCLDPRANTWKTDPQGKEDREEFRLLSDQITMLQDSLVRLEKMGKRYEIFMLLLEKYGRAFDISIRKTRNTVKLVTDEYEASQNMAEATQAMSGVMEGTDERTKLFDMTLEYVSQEIASNVAQVENFFDRTRSIIGSSDLQSDMAEEHLLAELSDMGDKTDQAIETLEAQGATSVQDIALRVKSAQNRVAASMPSGDKKYEDLFTKIRKN